MIHPVSSSIESFSPSPERVRGHPAVAVQTPKQALESFLGEVISTLIEPISSAFTENIFQSEDEEEEESNTGISSTLFKELGGAVWGRTLLEGGQFKHMSQMLEDQVKRLEASQYQTAYHSHIKRDV